MTCVSCPGAVCVPDCGRRQRRDVEILVPRARSGGTRRVGEPRDRAGAGGGGVSSGARAARPAAAPGGGARRACCFVYRVHVWIGIAHEFASIGIACVRAILYCSLYYCSRTDRHRRYMYISTYHSPLHMGPPRGEIATARDAPRHMPLTLARGLTYKALLRSTGCTGVRAPFRHGRPTRPRPTLCMPRLYVSSPLAPRPPLTAHESHGAARCRPRSPHRHGPDPAAHSRPAHIRTTRVSRATPRRPCPSPHHSHHLHAFSRPSAPLPAPSPPIVLRAT